MNNLTNNNNVWNKTKNKEIINISLINYVNNQLQCQVSYLGHMSHFKETPNNPKHQPVQTVL